MAITKEIVVAQIEVVGEFKCLQVAKDTVIKEDDVEISRSRHRTSYFSGDIDTLNSNAWTNTDISAEPTEVQTVANAVWTDAVKLAWKNKLIADKG
tara:strand:- start:74 stop:361 length:288 start_codon:yes stop_codon:yes gene_type:complete